jgi:hypothetical protein
LRENAIGSSERLASTLMRTYLPTTGSAIAATMCTELAVGAGAGKSAVWQAAAPSKAASARERISVFRMWTSSQPPHRRRRYRKK